MFDDKYKRIETEHPYGPLILTVYTPQDADWITRHVLDMTVDLHNVQSAIVTVGHSFIVLERKIDRSHLQFDVQSYRPSNDVQEAREDIIVDVLAGYPPSD